MQGTKKGREGEAVFCGMMVKIAARSAALRAGLLRSWQVTEGFGVGAMELLEIGLKE